MTFSITTLIIMGFLGNSALMTLSINYTKENAFSIKVSSPILMSVIMLSAIMLSVILLNVIMPNVIMLSVIMLSVIMLSVNVLSVIMLSVVMLSVIMLSVNMECHHAECCYAVIIPSTHKSHLFMSSYSYLGLDNKCCCTLHNPGNTKGGSITVPLTSGLTGLD
jgi:hypothetical protein